MRASQRSLANILLSILLLCYITNASPAHRHIRRALPTLVSTSTTTIKSSSSSSTYISSSTVQATNSNDTSNSNITSYANTTTYYSGNYNATTPFATVSSTDGSYISNPVTIPDNAQLKNPHIASVKSTNGTVFVSFGSVLGLILIILAVIGATLSFKAWYSARHENQLKRLENGFGFDQFGGSGGYFGSDATSFVSSGSESYDDDEKAADMGEKVLRTKNSRLSLYSLGSNSALNILNTFENQDTPRAKTNNVIKNPALNSSRMSMFISPTEILQKETNQWGNNSNASSDSFFDSEMSTPTAARSAVSNTQVISNDYSEVNDSFRTGNAAKTKTFRPPSVHLDQLLDLQQDESDFKGTGKS